MQWYNGSTASDVTMAMLYRLLGKISCRKEEASDHMVPYTRKSGNW